MTLAPELRGALEATERLAAAGIVVGLGHTRANALTTAAALDAGARFATHLWNAMRPLRARTTGPVPSLLVDERATIGLIADGRHLHPLVEEITIRIAGPSRIALTSGLVPLPAHRPDVPPRRRPLRRRARRAHGALRPPGDRHHGEPRSRAAPWPDRPRAESPGYRADLAILDAELRPLQTIAAGETV